MKNKINSGAKGAKKNSLSIKDGPFFSSESKKRQKISNDVNGDFIESSESDEELVGDSDREDREEAEEDETAKETADETRKRFAIAHLEKLREIARRQKEDEEDELSGKESDDEGQRDSLVAQILQQEQLEESGRTRRAIASRVQQPETTDDFRVIVKHRQSVNAVVLSEDDSRGFSASKDGTILHWDVDGGKCEKYRWPSDELLRSHGAKDPQGRATRHSKNVLALAISPDGRYLASGGTDRHVHLWDTRTREHIQAFPGHRGTVSCLTFRQGSSEIFSGSYDRTVKIWNVEDRAYINTLFGHQSEVLSIDCLRKERVLAVGRDRTMQLFKVPEESRLVFRAPASSLECCCFISNDEFLTGSDDGSFAMWNLLRKKPVCIIKNAHALSTAEKNIDREDIERIPNGHIENGDYITERFNHSSACSWVSSVTVCRNSDLAASGAGNGSVHLWAIANESKEVKALYDLPLAGFVNSLVFAKSGAFLVAGVAQEPRLGRWGRIPAARNGVAVHTIKLS